MAVDRLKLLADLYGFPFPEDLALSFEVLKKVKPLEPLKCLSDALDVHLVGPFEVLAGRFDKIVPLNEMLLHWRFRTDPPELFTVAVRGEDEMHWGYWLKDPKAQDRSKTGHEGSTIACGSPHVRIYPQPVDRTFLGVVRLLLEVDHARVQELDSLGVMMEGEREQFTKLSRLRDTIGRYSGSHPAWISKATGEEWLLGFTALTRPLRKKVADPPTLFTVALSRIDQHLLSNEPNEALQLVQFLWPKMNPKREEEIWPRLREIYQMTNRSVLGKICQMTEQYSQRTWVDIAEME
ncbi:MAG: DUF2228 domain-containing protein [Planctomycetota bacterium]|nr:DUF2228 domain-containing protein [Planctomycetota bacterium]